LPVRAAAGADLAVILYLGVVQVGLAYVFLTRGLRHVPAFEASALLLLEPVMNPVWAWLVHHERPGGWALAGGTVIIVATLVNTWAGADRARRASSSKVSGPISR
jgi:drug/metabolite transporter, DME family